MLPAGEAGKQSSNSSGQVGGSLGDLQGQDTDVNANTKDSRANTGIGLVQTKLTSGQSLTSTKLGLLTAAAAARARPTSWPRLAMTPCPSSYADKTRGGWASGHRCSRGVSLDRFDPIERYRPKPR